MLYSKVFTEDNTFNLTTISLANESHHQRTHETVRNDIFSASLGCISQEKRSHNHGWAQHPLLLYLCKALIQLLRDIEVHTILCCTL